MERTCFIKLSSMATHQTAPLTSFEQTAWFRAIATFSLLCLAACMALAPTLSQMAKVWATSSHHYGYFVAPLTILMIYTNRDELAALTPKPSVNGVIGVWLAAMIWLLANAAGVALVEQIAFVSIIAAVALATLGPRIVSVIAFPLAFLFFMVPVGASLVPILQHATVAMVSTTLAVWGLPATADGFFITTEASVFHVIEACAGFRFFIAAVLVAGFFGHLVFEGWRKKTIFMITAGLFAIFANGARASLMVTIATVTDLELAVGDNHLFLGWICYAIAFVALLSIGMKFADRRVSEPRPARALDAGYRAPFHMLAVIAPLLLAPLYAKSVIENVADVTRTSAPVVTASGWSQTPATANWRPSFPGADDVRFADFETELFRIQTALGFYTHDRNGHEIIQDQTRAYDGKTWKRASTPMMMLSINGTQQAFPADLIYTSGGERMATLTIYWLDDNYYRSAAAAKFQQMRHRLFGENNSGGVLMIAAPYDDDPQTAYEAIGQFIDAAALPGALLTQSNRIARDQ